MTFWLQGYQVPFDFFFLIWLLLRESVFMPDGIFLLRRAVFADVFGVKCTTHSVSVVLQRGSLDKLLCSQCLLPCKVSEGDDHGSDT